MSEFKYKKVLSFGPSPEELKKPVDISSPREIIQYNRKIYAVRYLELRNIGLDYFSEIVHMCQEKGLEDPAFFGRACMYCGNATTNIEDLIGNGDDIVIIDKMPKVNCTYQSDKKINIATTFSSRIKKQKPFYAIEKSCAFDDSLVKYLADNSLLEPYEINFDFDFKSISDFSPDDKIPKEYLIQNVEKRLPLEKNPRKGLLNILKNLIIK